MVDLGAHRVSVSLTKESQLRGVNLGNWLLLEKWMHPRLFDGTDA